ncbi:MAG: RpiB/LacA/LacB family sugar-phosphate isomerase [Bacilli bacterium]|nr:RpiB/LacA/LacB family sugar-phosphate isomerase [Bacilli bacterium]
MKIYIGADYGAIDLKLKVIDYLKSLSHEVIDVTENASDVNDYPIIAFAVGEAVRDNEGSFGIAICKSGQGMCVAANKVKRVRCIRAATPEDAFLGRDHDSANVLSLGSEVTTDFEMVKKILDAFFNTPNPTLDRRLKRIELLNKYEDEN